MSEKMTQMLRATGFADDVPAKENEGLGENVFKIDLAYRGDRGDPFTRAERAKLRDMLDLAGALTNHSTGCPIAAKIARR